MHSSCVLLLVGALSVWAAQQKSAETKGRDYTLSVDVDLVVFNATALDSKGRPVKGLSKDNFRLFEDDREQQIKFVRPEDVPATVGLVIDNSGSMRQKKSDVIEAALAFVESSNPQDEIFIVNFNERVSMGLPEGLLFTNDVDQLRNALARIHTDGKTALYDAIGVALKHLDSGTYQRKALVVLSDGGDNASASTLSDVLKMSEQSSATIYAVGIFGPDDKDKNPKVLRQLAQLSGGETYLPQRLDELNDIWRRIAGGIRNQYIIGYVSTNLKHDGTFRNVKVYATSQDGKPLRVRARRGYAR